MEAMANDTYPTRRRTLVALHGSGDSARTWNLLRDALAERLPAERFVALDLPGHGALAAQPLPGHLRVEDYAAWVRAELERRALGTVVLVGHSLGSAITLRLALDAPERVAGLVLVGVGARLRVLPALLELARTQPEAAERELLARGFAPAHVALREAYRATLAPVAADALARDLAACDAFDVMSELTRVTQPACVVCGADDALTPLKYATFLRDALPDARLVVIPGAGHYVQIEAPAAVAEALSANRGAFQSLPRV